MPPPILKTRSRRLSPKPGRLRDRRYLAHIAALPCCIPGCRNPANVHHLRVPGAGAAAGKRSPDSQVLPVCAPHHQGPGSIHATGGEAAWWAARGIDPLALAQQLRAEYLAGEMP